MAFPALPESWSLDGLTFNQGEQDGVSRLLRVDDWDSSASGQPELVRRVNGHGSYRGANYLGTAIYTLTGTSQVSTGADRQAEIDRICGLCIGPDLLFALTRMDAGGTQRTAWCERNSSVAGQRMPDGVTYKWSLQLLAADPFKYGAPNPAQSTGLAVAELDGIRWNGTTSASGGTGVEWNARRSSTTGLVYQRAAGTAGLVVLTNDGNADAPIEFTIEVASNGLVINPTMTRQDTSERITFGEIVQAGSTVVIDTLAGTATLDGVDRGGSLTADDFFVVPAHSSINVLFTADGGSNTTLTAVSSNVYA